MGVGSYYLPDEWEKRCSSGKRGKHILCKRKIDTTFIFVLINMGENEASFFDFWVL
jgi:hypothetical protein